MGDLTYKATMILYFDVPKGIDSLGDCQWFMYKSLRQVIENPACDVLDDFSRILEQEGIGWDISIMEPVSEQV